MTEIRCLLNTSKGINTTVNEYMLKSGKRITEVIKNVGDKQVNTREIYKNELGYPEQIVDRIFGTLGVYYPSKSGVVYEAGGVKKVLPTSMDNIVNNGI